MAIKKMTDSEFTRIATPLMARNVTLKEIALATGLSISGVRYRLHAMGLTKKSTYGAVETHRGF